MQSKEMAAAESKTAVPARTAASSGLAPLAFAVGGKLAVLELRNFAKNLTCENSQYFTDLVRSAALKAQPQLEVITPQNLLRAAAQGFRAVPTP